MRRAGSAPPVRSRRTPRGARTLLHDERAVSDVVGSILLVGITVVMATGLSLVILNIPGPTDLVHAELRFSLDAGTGGWGTGDEEVRVSHLGGEPLARDQARILITISGTTETFEDNALIGPFTDGQLTIGETWSVTKTLSTGLPVAVDVITLEVGGGRIISGGTLTSPGMSVDPCAADGTAPVVAIWNQAPNDVATATTGAVTVRADITDNCAGVNTTVAPHLWYRINDGGNPAYTDLGAMSLTGPSQWSGDIPDPTWANHQDEVLEYYVAGMQDLNGNSGDSPVRSDTIQAGDPCATETNPPTVNTWTQTPNDVNTQTSGAVTVEAILTDDCAGVDESVDPDLFYRVNDGSDPAYASVAMTRTATDTWQADIPDQGWNGLSGDTLEYYVGGMTDLNGNVGDSTVQQDAIQFVLVYTYVDSFTATSGTVSSFANAQSASDSSAVATITEAGTAGGSTTATLDANAVDGLTSGWSNGANGFSSDDSRATSTNSGARLQYGLADPGVSSGTITSVVIRAEVSISGYNNDAFTLYACFDGTCNAGSTVSGSGSDVVRSYDVTSARPGGGSWSWSDINNLELRIDTVQNSGGGPPQDGTWRVDHAFAEVTYQGQTYDTDVRMDFSGVPIGLGYQLELRYRTSGDTFNVQVWNGLSWTTRGATLNSGTLDTWSYSLTASEYQLGSPRVRFVDNTPAGTTQGSLELDYVRVLTQ